MVDADRSATSRALVRHVDALRAVQVVSQPADLAQARAQLEAGQVDGIVLIPARLERDILRGGSGELVLLGNGAYLSRASAILSGLAEGVTAFARQQAVHQAAFMGAPQAAPLVLVQRPLYNTREGYGSSVVPGVSELIVHQTLLGAAFVLVGVCGLLYYVGFTAWVQDYPRGGNVPVLMLSVLLFALATVPFGLFVGSFFSTRERAFQYVTGVSIPLFFLSNLSWPALASPPLLVALAKLLPTTPGINAIVRTQQLGARLPEIAGELLNLLLLALLYGSLVLWRLHGRRRH